MFLFFFFSSRRRHTRWTGDWSSDVCSSDLMRREVPECIDVAADGTKIGPAGVQVVDPAGVLLHIFFYFADAGIKDKRMRSEERRVGKECRSRWSADHEKKIESKMCVVGKK